MVSTTKLKVTIVQYSKAISAHIAQIKVVIITPGSQFMDASQTYTQLTASLVMPTYMHRVVSMGHNYYGPLPHSDPNCLAEYANKFL